MDGKWAKRLDDYLIREKEKKSALALRAELEEQNIELKVKGDQLALKAPSGKLHPALRDAVVTHKQALIQLLKEKPAPAGADDLGKGEDDFGTTIDKLLSSEDERLQAELKEFDDDPADSPNPIAYNVYQPTLGKLQPTRKDNRPMETSTAVPTTATNNNNASNASNASNAPNASNASNPPPSPPWPYPGVLLAEVAEELGLKPATLINEHNRAARGDEATWWPRNLPIYKLVGSQDAPNYDNHRLPPGALDKIIAARQERKISLRGPGGTGKTQHPPQGIDQSVLEALLEKMDQQTEAISHLVNQNKAKNETP